MQLLGERISQAGEKYGLQSRGWQLINNPV
jgi:hypothetical protein